jgi:hypothetical protein
MRHVVLQIALILERFLSWFRPTIKFKVGDVIAAKHDAWTGRVVESEYFIVTKIDRETVYATRDHLGVIYFNPKDIVKIELSDLEKVIYGLE